MTMDIVIVYHGSRSCASNGLVHELVMLLDKRIAQSLAAPEASCIQN
jgi:hypothetical protein